MKTRLFFIFLLLASPLAHAKFFKVSNYHTYGPFESETQNPLFLHFLQMPLEKVTTTPKKDFDISLQTNFTNLFERNLPATGYGVDLDMELLRNTFKIRYGLTNKFEIGANIPVMGFYNGFLDGFLQDYHNAFGFPNAGRNLVPNGRFSYKILKNGSTVYQANKTLFGLGDIPLTTKLHLIEEGKRRFGIAVKGVVKIPTGSASHGTGSGYPDVGVSILAQKSYKRFHSYSQAGLIIVGGHTKLSDNLTRGGAAFFNQAFEVNVTEHLSLITQIDGQTSYLGNTSLKELSGLSLNLISGIAGGYNLKGGVKKITYQVSLSEDMLPDGPAIDFTLASKVGIQF